MGVLTYSRTLVAGAAENINDVSAMFNDVANVLNGNVDAANLLDGGITAPKLAVALATQLGSTDSVVRRGKVNIPTTESRSGVYGWMPTPDRVSNVVLPTDGLVFVAYQATMQESSSNQGRAAIFLGANQLKSQVGSGTTVQEANTGGAGINVDFLIGTSAGGLLCNANPNYSGDVTTGQLVGINNGNDHYGIATIFAAAGTYDIGVQYKATTGTVTAKNRKLWVWTMGF